jgi:hypothetical protein
MPTSVPIRCRSPFRIEAGRLRRFLIVVVCCPQVSNWGQTISTINNKHGMPRELIVRQLRHFLRLQHDGMSTREAIRLDAGGLQENTQATISVANGSILAPAVRFTPHIRAPITKQASSYCIISRIWV